MSSGICEMWNIGHSEDSTRKTFALPIGKIDNTGSNGIIWLMLPFK